MPSGLTHIILTKMFQDMLPNGDLRKILASGTYSLQVGSIAPDMPYASIADNDILHNRGCLADDFHYKSTNQIPLQSLVMLKERKDSVNENIDQMFSFYLGYISHVFADGIIHPFIRDKVGDYKENKASHREFELDLDVLLYNHQTISSGYGFELIDVNMQDELMDFPSSKENSEIIKTFIDLINGIYSVSYSNKDVFGSISGLNRLYNLVARCLPNFIRRLLINTSYTYKKYDEIDFNEVTQLLKTKDGSLNFLHVELINFLEDCLPQFFTKFQFVAQKAYDYVYKDGPALSEIDIPLIDLDTGRLVTNNNLDELPVLWIKN